ncbi:MAG: type II toxin-antitoxin system PemK/MazF family toxin [Acetobacteraceae bacterium]|nr:type II toxin-antitoxin system PemK/MazF family toxin [Acetobacteraceae bacterium]
MLVRRGDIFYADLSPVVGSEQGGIRPVLVIQNDIGNRYSPTVIVAAITSQREKVGLPIHVEVKAEECGLERNSTVLLEQLRTIDRRRLRQKVAHLGPETMARVDDALAVSVGLCRL